MASYANKSVEEIASKKYWWRTTPYLFWYVKEQAEELKWVLEHHRRFKRVSPMLTVRFKWSGKRFGNAGSAVVVDLDKRILVIKGLGVTLRLNESTCRELRYILEHYNDIKFIVQLVSDKPTRSGRRRKKPSVHIIVIREAEKIKLEEISPPLLIIAIDVNSRHGFTVRAFLITKEEVKLVWTATFKPPNHTRRRRERAKLQKLLAYTRDPMYAYLLKKNAAREKALNWEFARKVVSKLRKIGRYYRDKYGATIVVLVDKPDPNSIRNSQLQNTLLKVAKAVENMCLFEGFYYHEYSGVSGRVCPFCERGMELFYKTRNCRVYYCLSCSFTADRDALACWRLALIWLENHFPELKGELEKKLLELWWKSKPPKFTF